MLSVNTGSVGSFEAAVDNGADIVYIGGEGSEPDKDDYRYAIEYGRKNGTKVFISTPRIIKNIRDSEEMQLYLQQSDEPDTGLKPDGFLVPNTGLLYHLHRLNPVTQLVADYPINVFNRLAMDYILSYSERVTLTPELTLKEIENLAPFGRTECIVHGLFPLIISEHNLVRGLALEGTSGDICLKDEKGFAFPVRTDLHGRTYIMNSRELCMLEHVPDLIRAGINCLRIEAKTYDRETTRKLTLAYREAMDNINIRKSFSGGKYTTGHYFRGIT